MSGDGVIEDQKRTHNNNDMWTSEYINIVILVD